MLFDVFLRPRELARKCLDNPNIVLTIFLNISPILLSFIIFAAIGIILDPKVFVAGLLSPTITTIVLALLTFLTASAIVKIPQKRNFLGIWQAFSFGWIFLILNSIIFSGTIFILFPGVTDVMHLKANNLITDDEFIAKVGEIMQNAGDVSFWFGFLIGVSVLIWIGMLIYWYIVLQETMPGSRLKQLASYIAILIVTIFIGFLRDNLILSIFG